MDASLAEQLLRGSEVPVGLIKITHERGHRNEKGIMDLRHAILGNRFAAGLLICTWGAFEIWRASR